MTDNNTKKRRLQEIGNQPSTSDPQLDRKNLLQYLIAGAIGLGVVVVPLIMLFELGGTPTATKLTAPEVEDTTFLAEKELNNLKAQVALEIQVKPERQTVARKPKSASIAVKTSSKTVAPTPQAKPVATAPSPKPKTIAIEPPKVIASTPTAQPVTIAVARPIVKPIAAPVPIQLRPATIQVAVQAPTVIPVRSKPPSPSVGQSVPPGMFDSDIDKSGTEALASTDRNFSPTPISPVEANVTAAIQTPAVPKATAAVRTPERGQSPSSNGEVDRLPTVIPTKPMAVNEEDSATTTPASVVTTIQSTEEVNTPSSFTATKPSRVATNQQPIVTPVQPIQSAPSTTTEFIQPPAAVTISQPAITAPIPVMRTPSTTAATETAIDGSTADRSTLMPQQQSTLPQSPASTATGFTVTEDIQPEAPMPENKAP
jgi:hypothetical protein